MNNQAHKSHTPDAPPFSLWLMAGEIGLILAVPLVSLLLAGIKLDNRLHTSPLFTIAGIVLAAVISITAIVHKIKRVQKGQ